MAYCKNIKGQLPFLYKEGSGELKRLIAPLNPPQSGSGFAKARNGKCAKAPVDDAYSRAPKRGCFAF
jgi:hypothetical protein